MVDPGANMLAAVVRPLRPVEVAATDRRAVSVALAHDWLCGERGGERVLERLAVVALELAPAGARPVVLTMFDDGKTGGGAVRACDVRASGLSGVPGARRLRRWMLPLYPRAVKRLSEILAEVHRRSPIDLLVSSSSVAVKGVRAPLGVPHVCYCHAPARYLWSQRSDYSGGLRGAGLRLFSKGLREWDRANSEGVTEFIANSRHTAAQILACYGRESVVAHPPARTEFFTPDERVRREDFWLVAGALEPYKRVDLAISAARACGARLVVAGGGSQGARLRKLAGPRCEFVGRVSDEELRDLYRRARLLVYPQVEDFGITAVEAQACGLPVVARRAGGALDSVDEGSTGVFFDEPTAADVARAAARAPVAGDVATTRACREKAEKFSESEFDAKITGVMLRAARRG